MDQQDIGRVEKLAEVGRQTLDLFHEMNNNFSVMMGMLEIINMKYTDIDPALKQCLDKIYLYIERSVELVHDTLGRTRKEKKRVTLSEINEILKNTIRNVTQYNGFKEIAFYTNLEHSFREVIINTLDFEHILMNLFNNSRDAIITTGKPGAIYIRTHANAGQIEIEIADTGPGVAPDIREKIFDPFFTTKDTSAGTGLGLSKCREIIADSKGDLILDADYNEGAKFIVKLPIV